MRFETIGEALRHARERRKLSQAKLAEMIKTTQPHICWIEANDVRVTVQSLEYILDALQASLYRTRDGQYEIKIKRGLTSSK